MTTSIQDVGSAARTMTEVGSATREVISVGTAARQLARIANLAEQRPPGCGALVMIHYGRDDTDGVDWMADQLGLPAAHKSADGQRYTTNREPLGDVAVHVLCGITEPPEDEAARLRRRLAELDEQIAQAGA